MDSIEISNVDGRLRAEKIDLQFNDDDTMKKQFEIKQALEKRGDSPKKAVKIEKHHRVTLNQPLSIHQKVLVWLTCLSLLLSIYNTFMISINGGGGGGGGNIVAKNDSSTSSLASSTSIFRAAAAITESFIVQTNSTLL